MAGHLDIVQAVKAELEAAGILKPYDQNDPSTWSGACGAFRLTNRVANRVGFKLLRKAGGNRAIPQSDGSCLDGDHGSGSGYATDYLIDPVTFYGYDILGDGGGANNPQWPEEPETDPEMVKRNRENAASPVPDGTVVVPPVDPPPTGTQGPPGPQGPQGPKGEKGDKGDPGTGSSVPLKALIDRIEKLEAKKVPTGVRSTLSWSGVSSRLTYD